MKIFELLYSEIIADIHSPVDVMAEMIDEDPLNDAFCIIIHLPLRPHE